jgi:hypothetical protein
MAMEQFKQTAGIFMLEFLMRRRPDDDRHPK